MNRKILILSALISMGMLFQSCEKEENYNANSNGEETNFANEKQKGNAKTGNFGDPNQELLVTDKAQLTKAHFEDLNEIPGTNVWFNYFNSIYDSGLTIEVSFENEAQTNSIATSYFDAYFGNNTTTYGNIDQFRDSWLQTVAISSEINSDEKTYISNLIYATVGMKKIFLSGIIVTNDYPPSSDMAHPWDIAFNNCMRRNVPSGFLKRIGWVLSGNIFIDVADCIIEATQVINGAEPGNI